MVRKFVAFAGLAVVASASSVFAAGPVGVDGTIGSDWSGIVPVSVTHDPLAPVSNFTAPGNTTAGADYDVYVRDDGTYYYVAETITGNAASSAGGFMNVYLDVNPSLNNGAEIGFEVVNQIATIPGLGTFPYTPASTDIHFAISPDSQTIEFAVPNSFFTSNPFGAESTVRVEQSQSFGYSVAGGSSYGPSLLGSASIVATPEPASLGLLAIGGVGLLARRRRRAV